MKTFGTIGSFIGAMFVFRWSYGAWLPAESNLWSWLTTDPQAKSALLFSLVGVVVGGFVGQVVGTIFGRKELSLEKITKEIEINQKIIERENDPFKDWWRKWREKNVPQFRPGYVPKDKAEMLILKALLVYNAGRSEETIKILKDAVKTNPECAPAYEYMGNAFRRLERPEEAMKCFSRAVEIEPSMTIAHFNLGGIYLKMGNEQNAIIEFLKVLTLDPDFLPAHWNLAIIYSSKGNYKDAVKELNEILRIDPSDADAKIDLEKYTKYANGN